MQCALVFFLKPTHATGETPRNINMSIHSAEKKIASVQAEQQTTATKGQGKGQWVHLATHQGLSVITQWDLAVLLCLH